MTGLPTILIVDDDLASLDILSHMLGDDFDVHMAASIEDADQALGDNWVQAVVCSEHFHSAGGLDFLNGVRERYPDVVRLMSTASGNGCTLSEAMNDAGLFQLVSKPFQPENLIPILKNACRLYQLQRENELMAIELKVSCPSVPKRNGSKKPRLNHDYDFEDGIIRDRESPMNGICETLKQVAPYDVPVLLSGASGTGKELAARALHFGSLRWNKPFVVENCGALPDQLLESELFGHKRGAFTGAVEDHIGLFERADGGTVFLDEIGEVSPAFQVKLLRVLQEGEIRPVGSAKTRRVDVRVVAATNRDLDEEVREGRFRADLYYRLAGMVIRLPELKDRRCDIPVLARALLSRAMNQLGKQVPGLSGEAFDCMMRYNWPGNVRELQNEIQQMLVMGVEGHELGADLLSRHILSADPQQGAFEPDFSTDDLAGTLKDRIEMLEARVIRETLIRHRWNKSQAARELGLSRVGLRSKLDRYGLENIKSLHGAERVPAAASAAE